MRAGLRADRAIAADARNPRARTGADPARGGDRIGRRMACARAMRGSRRDGGIVRPRPAGGQRGFSLLEILLVMVLIAATGLLAAGVLTGGFDRMALGTAAKEMAAQMRFARAHAIATGQPQRFTIDPAARTWQGANGRSGELPAKLDVRFTGAREVQPRGDVGAIVFFGDGASTGGRLQLGLRDAVWNVDVAWLTGEVSVRRGGGDG